MVNAFNTAVTGGADGIGVCLVDKKAFNQPTDAALKAKIPVLAYNADEVSNARLAYIGQDLFASGVAMGKRIQGLVPSGDVALFIATPGQSEHPAADRRRPQRPQEGLGHQAARRSPPARQLPAELSVINSYAQSHPETKGYFAVDAGSTQGLAQTIQKQKLRDKGVKGGGYDLTPVTQNLLAADQIDFTIDQQPYLQGFFPIMELYLAQGVGNAVGRRRRQHRPEVPRQDDGRPLQQHQEPLRGHLERSRGRQGLRHEREQHLQPGAVAGAGRRLAGARVRQYGRGPAQLLVRFLTLREGSIIVVTLLTTLYFSLTTTHFFTHANFVNVLPYFAPFAILAAGEVLLMVAGEIDLSIGSVYLFAPFMFYEFDQAGLPLVAVPDPGAPRVLRGGRGDQRRLHRGLRRVVVHHDARHAARRSAGLTLIISHAQPVAMPGAEVTTHTVNVTTSSTGRRSCCPSRSTRSGRSRRSSAPARTPS